ncbi:MAG: hypothetical protein J5546_10010 [Lachnospiraceae bacterium]|nr:hypothetical protein [Lachnospiraceae bacterium]
MAFLGSVLSYGIVLLCFVAVGVAGFFVGLTMRKRKDAKLEREKEECQEAQDKN